MILIVSVVICIVTVCLLIQCNCDQQKAGRLSKGQVIDYIRRYERTLLEVVSLQQDMNPEIHYIYNKKDEFDCELTEQDVQYKELHKSTVNFIFRIFDIRKIHINSEDKSVFFIGCDVKSTYDLTVYGFYYSPENMPLSENAACQCDFTGFVNEMNYKGNGWNYYTERIGEKWFYYELHY